MKKFFMMNINRPDAITRFNEFVRDKNIIEVTCIANSSAVLIYWEE